MVWNGKIKLIWKRKVYGILERLLTKSNIRVNRPKWEKKEKRKKEKEKKGEEENRHFGALQERSKLRGKGVFISIDGYYMLVCDG